AARHTQQRLDMLLASHWPKRFAQQWLGAHDALLPLREIGEARLAQIAKSVHAWAVMPSGTLGYAKAEVTLGGVDTRGLSSRSMAANRAPGLYFIGEVVDVTGWLGGFNFQWAWSSAHAAAQAV
ncbi:MAG: NAD(P)/FAD-dependent oxidoreductase, partial [Casimicrobiaceae bacterium]